MGGRVTHAIHGVQDFQAVARGAGRELEIKEEASLQ